MPPVSLIIPMRNSRATLPMALSPLAALPEHWEIVLVDDGSHDGSAQLAAELLPRARLVTVGHGRGAAAARNAGVAASGGELLVFVDSDVSVEPAVLRGLEARMQQHPSLAAVFGAYCPAGFPKEPPVSRFRNALHSFMHHRHAGPATTFWTGLGAVRRDAFEHAGGFDARCFSLEDVEFGYRLHRLGYRIELDPQVRGTHWKRWTLSAMLMTDVWNRAATWTEIGLRGEIPLNRLNTEWTQKLALLCLAATLLSLLAGKIGHAVQTSLVYALIQLPFLQFVYPHGGLVGVLHGLALLPVYHFCCGLGFLCGLLRHARYRLAQRTTS